MLSVVVTLTDAGTAVVCRSFFVKGRKFRQPAYLATSFSEAVARQFLAMRGGSDCVLWRVRFVCFSFTTTESLDLDLSRALSPDSSMLIMRGRCGSTRSASATTSTS